MLIIGVPAETSWAAPSTVHDVPLPAVMVQVRGELLLLIFLTLWPIAKAPCVTNETESVLPAPPDPLSIFPAKLQVNGALAILACTIMPCVHVDGLPKIALAVV
jgi:hypothetical protein